jgi:hypothetical protein
MCVIPYLDMLHSPAKAVTDRLQACMCFCMRALGTCATCPTHESHQYLFWAWSPSALRCLPTELAFDHLLGNVVGGRSTSLWKPRQYKMMFFTREYINTNTIPMECINTNTITSISSPYQLPVFPEMVNALDSTRAYDVVQPKPNRSYSSTTFLILIN